MKHTLLSAVVFATFALNANAATVLTSSNGAITIGVFASSAPNAFGSPSWSTYVSNGMNWLQNGGLLGDGLTPSSYTHASPDITPGDATVSSFTSWRGVADPDSPFENERGNRIHFGLRVEAGSGITFMLSDITYSITSSDANLLGISGDFASANSFSSTRIGITTSGTVLNSGTAENIALSAFYFIGVGNAYTAGLDGTDQERLDAVYNYVQALGSVELTGEYTVAYSGTNPGTFSVADTVTIIPEPTTTLLGGLGLLALLRRRR